jgi:hypothetical protein
MIFLYHENDKNAEAQVDSSSFSIPPGELWEVPDVHSTDNNREYITPAKIVAELILKRCWYHGMIVVPVERVGNSFNTNMEAAEKQARQALRDSEDHMLTNYVNWQKERMASTPGAVALPPGGTVQKIIEKRGIDLKRDFNIDPPGYVIEKGHATEDRMKALEQENAEMKEMLKQLLAKKTKEPTHA